MPVKLLLLVHDLSDAAVHRRAVMLRAGGASVTVAGFRRTPEPISNVAGCPAIDFGRTYNERFAQRIFSVMREVALIGRRRALVRCGYYRRPQPGNSGHCRAGP
jgi:succinoglycan biosynthesis protein ExoL